MSGSQSKKPIPTALDLSLDQIRYLDNRLLETSTLNTCRRSGRLGLLERQLQVGISDI